MTFALAAMPFWLSAAALLYAPVFAMIFRSNSINDIKGLLDEEIYHVPENFSSDDGRSVGRLKDLSLELTTERLLAIASRAGESSAVAASSLALAVTLITNSVIQEKFGLLATALSVLSLLSGFLMSGIISTMSIERYTRRRRLGPFTMSTAVIFAIYMVLGLAAGIVVLV
ncbi:hypothetical protein [Microbacterium binotii]|uniref:hypothetical protein n=1 Tax=Microbacterium binotii TaxID=462710 RepID=UPI001F3A36E4|nr:hypothetical protein [Microbacterium binotii]UIN31286.1 hypothetical protein LXM64_03520 [Microbacterium binotii]